MSACGSEQCWASGGRADDAGAAPGLMLAEPATSLVGEAMRVRAGERLILDGVDLRVDPGELVGVIGPNGAGKSTALGALSGDVPLASGQVRLGASPVGDLSARSQARLRAVLPQSHEVGFSYLVHDVVMMGRTAWQDNPELDEELAAWAMGCTQVSALRDREVPTLSGGELARVHLARVLAQRTGLLLLDEPTAALDVAHQEAVLALAWKLTRLPAPHTRGVLAVLHDLSLAAAWCDRLVLLRDGQVVADGAPWQVCRADLLSEVYGWELCVRPDPDTGTPLITPRRRRPTT
ncbi:heme ABC transporter ATP-binding protein [Actinomyces urogenitalis]|uniref:heme ABC transporter ATP-binding protein n=1 Tax=Actinomyces urogenitalis TaxID=103621 RepID=UPI0024321D9A|nr:heme ABC transporter ATP-binding protein [Actinomyces urogenitalis]MCI7456260.1 heme ABC transporter ATP-binding protein [Actinomyces urogenitalis]